MSLPFTPTELLLAVSEGQVSARPHPTLPLTIFNYTPEVQYSNKWNDITINCRGLILDADFNIVARPWKKFFNLGQVNLPIQLTDPVEVMDKADGSLGILYPAGDGNYSIATRGSFMSEQAKHASDVWLHKYSHLRPLSGYTLLFEIVYPENRIVLNYDGMDDLILLGAVATESGHYYGPNVARYLFRTSTGREADWKGPVVKVFDFNTISDALGHMERENAEGYVIRSHNFMVKLKQPDYLELHRLVSNMTPKSIWEQLRLGKSVEEICSALPDEFHSMAQGFAEPLVSKYAARLEEILGGYSKAMWLVTAKFEDGPTFPDRKDFAMTFKKYPDARYYFALLDDKPIADMLWMELKPKEAAYESLQESM